MYNKDHGTTTINRHVTSKHLEVLALQNKKELQPISHMMFHNLFKRKKQTT